MISCDFQPQGVCARSIHVELSDDASIVEGVSFEGGCSGNLKAIGRLVQGMEVERVSQLLSGNICGKRSTSCADQLCHALSAAQQLRA